MVQSSADDLEPDREEQQPLSDHHFQEAHQNGFALMQERLVNGEMPNLVSHRIVRGMDEEEDVGNEEDSLLFEFANRQYPGGPSNKNNYESEHGVPGGTQQTPFSEVEVNLEQLHREE